MYEYNCALEGFKKWSWCWRLEADTIFNKQSVSMFIGKLGVSWDISADMFENKVKINKVRSKNFILSEIETVNGLSPVAFPETIAIVRLPRKFKHELIVKQHIWPVWQIMQQIFKVLFRRVLQLTVFQESKSSAIK